MVKTLFRFQLPGIVWAALIFWLCTLPGSNFSTLKFPFPLPVDKCVHAFFHAVLAFLILLGFKNSHAAKPRYVGTLLTCSLYGLFIEFFQSEYVPTRGAEVADEIANITGALFGVLIFRYYRRCKYVG